MDDALCVGFTAPYQLLQVPTDRITFMRSTPTASDTAAPCPAHRKKQRDMFPRR